jgi:uncharacterized SAM-binding protein YcdF (DUF218 family)
MIYLHKILPFFLSPLGVSLSLLILFFFYRKKLFVFLSLIILLISSNPLVANYLTMRLEKPYYPLPVQNIKKHDFVVVLSGMIQQVGNESFKKYEWLDPDRFFAGIKLIQNKKADKLIFTAGQLPWTRSWKPEGYILKDKAITLGISHEKIIVTDNVKNTYEESIALFNLVPKNSSIILVTSAFHMERSKLFFDMKGYDVTPFPVDFRGKSSNFTIIDFLPSIDALSKSSRFIRENIGRLYYKIIL